MVGGEAEFSERGFLVDLLQGGLEGLAVSGQVVKGQVGVLGDDERRLVAELEAQCRAFIAGPGEGALESTIEYSVEARYPNQVWEIEVPLPEAIVQAQVDETVHNAIHGLDHDEAKFAEALEARHGVPLFHQLP